MTHVNRQNNIPMARCKKCDSDLVTSKHNGWVYCTNMKCKHVRDPHPTKGETNSGEADI